VLNKIKHSRRWFNTLIPQLLTVGHVAYTFVRFVAFECARGVIPLQT